MQALASASQSILLGESECVLAGGIQSMSRMTSLIANGHGEYAEVLARQYGITRSESDQFAFESVQRAAAAQDAGHFAREIAPVAVSSAKGQSAGAVVERDEQPHRDATREALSQLPLLFGDVEGRPGIITVGSSAGISDGGAALVLASDRWAADRGLQPLARITGWASVGVEPHLAGLGPVPATAKLYERHGLELPSFDLVEIHEACTATRARGLEGHADSTREAQRQRRRHRPR